MFGFGASWVAALFTLLVLSGWASFTDSVGNSVMIVDHDIETYIQTIQTTFDKAYPTELELKVAPGEEIPKGKVQNIHDKRCFLQENAQAAEYFMSTINKNIETGRSSLPILAATPCLGSDSLGNNLAAYFENIVCANMVGIHYVSLAHIWEPEQKHQPSPFLEKIPTKILHATKDIPTDAKLVRAKMKNICKCPGSCHERPLALWTKGLHLIRPIFHQALQNHLVHIPSSDNRTVVRSRDLSNVNSGSSLPLIPDAAIHYRCGDNFIGHYGFLPFRAFTENIPTNISTLYVLAEQRNRKTMHRPYLAEKCDVLFTQLYQYLKSHFPTTTIVIRRGDNLVTDLARLTYAKYVVCSVSTFCLWPAVTNPHQQHVYFPKTKLIVGGKTEVQLGFQWLLNPPILLGKTLEGVPPKQFVNLLVNNVKTS